MLRTACTAGWVLLAVWVVAARAADNRVMEIYPLYTSEAAATVSALEFVIGDDGKVIYDRPGGRLLVLATEADQVRVREQMRELNVPPANIRIEVVVDETGRQELSSIGASGDGEVTVTDEGTDVDVTVRPWLQKRSGRTGKSTRQTLLLQSGGEAVLNVGEEVPFADWLVYYGNSQGYLPQAVEIREVGAVLRVQARVIGDGPLISLKLTPEITGMSAEGSQRIQYTRLSTDLTVEDGQTIDLGGLNENTEFYQKFLVGIDRSGNRRALSILATPHIERPGAPSAAVPTNGVASPWSPASDGR